MPIQWTKRHIKENGLLWQLFKYGVIGFIAFGMDMSVYLGLTRLGGLTPIPANVTSSFVGLIIIFAVNRRYTFQATKGSVRQQTKRFLIVSGVNYLLQQALLWLFLHWALLEVFGSWHDVSAKVLAIGLIVLSNFFGHRFWTFAHHPVSQPSEPPHALPTLPPQDL